MKKRLASVAVLCAMLMALSPLNGFKANASGESVSSDVPSTVDSSVTTVKSTESTTSTAKPAAEKNYIEVTGDTVNVRAGAGTNYKVVTSVKKGKRYKFYETKTVDGVKWYKIKVNDKEGWIVSTYVKEVESGTTNATSTVSQYQYVEITEKSVNVRAGAGTHCKILGTVKRGQRYKFYATKTVEGQKWYKIKYNGNDGWVAASCVKLVNSAVTTTTTTTKTTTTTTTTTTTKTTTTTTTTTKKTTATTSAPKYYVLVTGNNVNVRSGAGTNYGVVTTVQKGQELPYLGVKIVNGQKWYNVEVNGKKGWIIGTYSKLVSASSQTTATTAKPTATSKTASTTKKTTTKTAALKYYVLVTGNNVNIRSGAGTNYGVVTTVQKGQELPYLGVKTVNGQKWYNVEVNGKKGWIIGTYSKLVSTATTTTKKTTTTTANNHYLVVKGGTVYVRSGAGASYPKVTTVYMGQRFQYSDVKTVDKIKWYKITANGKTGWISGAYVKVSN